MTQATYDLTRLYRNSLIVRRPHANTYDLTPDGLKFAIFFYTTVHDRVLAPLFAAEHPQAPPQLRAALRPSNTNSTAISPPQDCQRQPDKLSATVDVIDPKDLLRSVRDFARKEWPPL